MLDYSDIGLFTLDPHFRIVEMNLTLETYFDVEPNDLLGRDMRQLLRNGLSDVLEAPGRFTETLLRTYENHIHATGLTCHVFPQGLRKERWLEYWSMPIRRGEYAGGRLECYRDITERQDARRRVRERPLPSWP